MEIELPIAWDTGHEGTVTVVIGACRRCRRELEQRVRMLLEARAELPRALAECEGALALTREQREADSLRLGGELDVAMTALCAVADEANHYGDPRRPDPACPHCIAKAALAGTWLSHGVAAASDGVAESPSAGGEGAATA